MALGLDEPGSIFRQLLPRQCGSSLRGRASTRRVHRYTQRLPGHSRLLRREIDGRPQWYDSNCRDIELWDECQYSTTDSDLRLLGQIAEKLVPGSPIR